jgi:uncharacterized protein YndB with AHSA1/START domain
MERKTKIHAEDGQQVITITREFDLPVDLLFRAHTDPEIFEQWMSHEYGTTKAVKLESKKHGSWKFQTSDAQGNVLYAASGVFHEFVPNQKITRTFEAENSPFDVQLEFLEFEPLTDDTSKLTMHSVFRSGELRDQLLKLPFAQGLNMANDRLEQVLSKLK